MKDFDGFKIESKASPEMTLFAAIDTSHEWCVADRLSLA